MVWKHKTTTDRKRSASDRCPTCFRADCPLTFERSVNGKGKFTQAEITPAEVEARILLVQATWSEAEREQRSRGYLPRESTLDIRVSFSGNRGTRMPRASEAGGL